MRKLLLILFAIIVLGPLLALVFEFAWPAKPTGRTLRLTEGIPTSRQWNLLARTALFALCVSTGALIIGTAAGSKLWCWNRGVMRWARWLVLLLVAVPPYVHALAWIKAVGAADSALHVFGLGLPTFQGWPAAWWVEVMAYVPVAAGLTLLGLTSVDPVLVEAARVSQADIRGFLKVSIPLALPQILAAGGLVFVLSMTDYGVPSLFGLNVYPLELYVLYSGGGPKLTALLLALPMLCVTLAVMVCVQRGLREAVQKPLWGTRASVARLSWPVWFVFLQTIGIVLVLSEILVPVLVLCVEAGSWANVTDAVLAARDELVVSLWVALLSGLVCLPLAWAMAVKLAEGSARHGHWWLLVTLPLAVPPSLVGIGLVAMWNRPVLGVIYGTLAMPVLASLVRFMPFGILVVLAQLRRIDPLLFEAGRLLHKSRLRLWFQISLPMLAPGLLAAACVVSSLTAGELGATLIVAPPGRATLTMRIYSYLHYGATENVAGLCLVMTVGVLTAGLMAAVKFRAWARLFSNAGRTGT